VKPMTGVKS
jgi:hypothetical protein